MIDLMYCTIKEVLTLMKNVSVFSNYYCGVYDHYIFRHIKTTILIVSTNGMVPEFQRRYPVLGFECTQKGIKALKSAFFSNFSNIHL